MDLREQILGNCRWLFNQEVNIVSFWRSHRGTNPYLRSGEWHVMVVPKNTSLQRLANRDINSTVLFKATAEGRGPHNLDALVSLNYAIGNRIADILQERHDGTLWVDKEKILDCGTFEDDLVYFEPQVPVESSEVRVPSVYPPLEPEVTSRPQNPDLDFDTESFRTAHEPPHETFRGRSFDDYTGNACAYTSVRGRVSSSDPAAQNWEPRLGIQTPPLEDPPNSIPDIPESAGQQSIPLTRMHPPPIEDNDEADNASLLVAVFTPGTSDTATTPKLESLGLEEPYEEANGTWLAEDKTYSQTVGSRWYTNAPEGWDY